jgi:hypothetical protein
MDLASLIVGIASFVVSAVPLLLQTIVYARRLSKYESLQRSFDDQSARLTKLAKNDEIGWERITMLLETGDMIMPHVIARFWRRLPVLLAVALGTATFSGATFNSGDWLSRGNIPALALIGVNWILSLATFLKASLFTEQETQFLRNFSLLNDLFYQSVVVDVIHKFNTRCKESISVSQTENEFKKDFEKLKRGFMKELEAPKVKMLPAETKDGTSGVKSHGSEAPRDPTQRG